MSNTSNAKPAKVWPQRPNIGWPRFLVYAVLYLALTACVAAALFFGIGIGKNAFNILGTEAFVYLLAAVAAFAAYKLQQAMSAAYGGGRVLDLTVSLPMLIVTAAAFLLWFGVPAVATWVTDTAEWLSSKIGYPTDLAASTYTVLVASLFGVVALYDIWFRDFLGVSRRSKTAAMPLTGFNPNDIRREDWVSGQHGDLPDVAIETGPRSGAPEIVNVIKRRHVIEDYLQDPFTGEDIRIPGPPTPRSAIRMREIEGSVKPVPLSKLKGGT